MRAEGKAVSIAQLCRWFGVPRSTFYYRPTVAGPQPRRLDPALVTTIRDDLPAHVYRAGPPHLGDPLHLHVHGQRVPEL